MISGSPVPLDSGIHELVAAQARRRPHAEAVRDPQRSPEVHLVRPAAGALLPADFPVEADVSDLYSSIDIVDLLFDQQPPAAMASGPAPRYAAQLSGIADGLHGIRVHARDS
ncbi:MAG: hypothetical protein J0L84_13195, partial [Verrucomicrobia bacterium]|nr:hypothetical protein [Verrucomicrobiota bacterium]